MSQYGFVYILGNEYMPNVFKIGCTERSPHLRAEELSKHTGVPAPFRVLCYAEFNDFQQIERDMHEWCKNHRINSGREFFQDCLPWAVSLLWYHSDRLSFTDATVDVEGCSELQEMVCEPHQSGIDYLRNPWTDKKQEDERQARFLRYHNLDFDGPSGAGTQPITEAEPAVTAEVEAEADALLKAVGEAATPDSKELPEVMPWERAQAPAANASEGASE